MAKNKDNCAVADALFDLFVARVSAVDTVHTVRTDNRRLFETSFEEARIALEVYKDKTNKSMRWLK